MNVYKYRYKYIDTRHTLHDWTNPIIIDLQVLESEVCLSAPYSALSLSLLHPMMGVCCWLCI